MVRKYLDYLRVVYRDEVDALQRWEEWVIANKSMSQTLRCAEELMIGLDLNDDG